MKHPHEILNKQAYIRGTNVKVKVTHFYFNQKKGSIIDVTFLDTPTAICYKLVSDINGSVNAYKEDSEEEITGTYAFKNIHNIPYDGRSADLLYNKEEV